MVSVCEYSDVVYQDTRCLYTEKGNENHFFICVGMAFNY